MLHIDSESINLSFEKIVLMIMQIVLQIISFFETNALSQLFIYFVLHVVANIMLGSSLCMEVKRKFFKNDALNGTLSPICTLKKDVYKDVLRTDDNFDEIILKLKIVISRRKYKASVIED